MLHKRSKHRWNEKRNFESNNSLCTNCGFIDLFNDNCMINAYANISDSLDNEVTRLQKRLFVSSTCGCTPSEDQIKVFNSLISKNKNLSYLTMCKNNSELCDKEISEDCLKMRHRPLRE